MTKECSYRQDELTEQERKRLERFGPAIDRLTLMDNVFLARFFQDNLKGVSFVLQKILDRDDVYASEVHIEHYIKNVHGRDIRFDIFAQDDTGKQYNIEIQRESSGAVPKRARFHSSMLDCAMLESGEDFSKMVETIVIFITEHDVLHGDETIYHVERIVKETGKPFRDEAHIIYVNSAKQDDTALGKLMHDFTCAEPKEMYYPEMKEKAYVLKYEQKERGKMAGVMEELLAEERAKTMGVMEELLAEERAKTMGVMEELIAEERRLEREKTMGVMEELIAEERRLEREKQNAENSRSFAIVLLQDGTFSIEKIAHMVKLDVAEVEALAKEVKVSNL